MTPNFDKLIAELTMPTRQSERSFLNISPLKVKPKSKKKKEKAKPATKLSGHVKRDGPPPGSTPATGLAIG